MNFTYIKEIFFIVDKGKQKLPLMCILFLIMSILDLAGIGLIAPYVTLIMDPGRFFETQFYDLYKYFGFSKDTKDVLIVVGVVLISVFVAKALIAVLINYVLLSFCHGQVINVRSSLMKSYQNLPYINYVDKNSSQYIHNINLAERFGNGALLALLRLLCDVIVVFAIVIFLGFVDIFSLATLVTLLLIFTIFYDKSFRPRVKKYGEIANTSSIQVLKSIQESMTGLKEVRILRKEDYFFKSMVRAAKYYARVSIKASMINLTPKFLMEVAMISFVVTLVFLALFMGKDMAEIVPTISMFGVACLKLAPLATSIIANLSKLTFFRDAVGLVHRDLTDAKENEWGISDAGFNKSLPFKEITLSNIHFAYSETIEPALNNISVKIKKADIIGFIGPSGSGKTTLVDIILGLLVPQKGEIFLNDTLLTVDTMSYWRSLIAYLPQDVFLIDDTLERNIALGVDDKDIDLDKINRAIEKAQLTDLVKNLPTGIDTIVGERGIRVSGGQKQRIALARAFYHEREVLVMDESTSALDTNTEREIVKEINRLKGEKTIIVIAHRISTLQHCTAIYRLENGVMSDKLTYEEISMK